MGQFSQFIINHWPLCLALVIILILILVNERLEQRKRGKMVSPQELIGFINNDNAVVIDLRDTESYRKGHIIDAIRASENDFSGNRMDKYKNKPLVLVCARGLQAGTLAAKLRSQGFSNPMVLSGGMSTWLAEGLPVIKGK